MADIKRSTVQWQGEGMEFRAQTAGGYPFIMHTPSNEEGATPMEYLLAGVAGCTAMDVISILQKKRQKVYAFEVQIEGTQADSDPHVFTHATITYILRGAQIDPAAVERAIELSATKYCSAQAMFERAGVVMQSSYVIEEMAAQPSA
jgi:putative redox protein